MGADSRSQAPAWERSSPKLRFGLLLPMERSRSPPKADAFPSGSLGTRATGQLTFAERDAAALEIVGRDFDQHVIARHNSDEVLAHFAGHWASTS